MSNHSIRERIKISTPLMIAVFLVLSIVSAYLIVAHQEHLLAYSNYILLVFFVVMHLFLHRGRHHRSD